MKQYQNDNEFRKFKMRVSLILVPITLICIGLFVNLIQTKNETNKVISEQTTELNQKDKKIDKLSDKNKELNEYVELSEVNNQSPESKQNQQFYETVRTVFNYAFTYDPSNVDQRKDKIGNLVADDLKDELFAPVVKGYNDNIRSKLNYVNVYSNVYYTESGERNALVMVNYESSYKDEEAKQFNNIWKISYDVSKNQITKMERLGVVNEEGEYH